MMGWTGNHKGCLYDDGFARHVLHRDEAWTALTGNCSESVRYAGIVLLLSFL